MELHRDARRRSAKIRTGRRLVVQPAGAEFARRVAVLLVRVAQARVVARSELSRLEVDPREEFVEALMRPILAGRTPLGRWSVERASEEVLDLKLPRIQIRNVRRS